MLKVGFKLRYLTNVGFCADTGGRGFLLPTAIAVRGDGRIFVTSHGSIVHKQVVGIQVVTRDHEYIGKIGGFGDQPGQMVSPSSLALDSYDNLYLSDNVLNRITVFDKTGNLISTWGIKGDGIGQFDGPSGLVIDIEGNVVVVDHKNNRIQKFTKDGKFMGFWGSFGIRDGQFNLPWGICKDESGNLYVADWRNDRIQKFTTDGEFISKFGSSGNGDVQLSRPSDVAVDSDANMYIADWGNQRVQVLNPNGNFLMTLRGNADLNPWASEYLKAQADEDRARSTFVPIFDVDTDDSHEVSARTEPYFWDPVSLDLDKDNRLYALETCRHRFQIYERY